MLNGSLVRHSVVIPKHGQGSHPPKKLVSAYSLAVALALTQLALHRCLNTGFIAVVFKRVCWVRPACVWAECIDQRPQFVHGFPKEAVMPSTLKAAWILSFFLACTGHSGASPVVSVGSGGGLAGSSFTVPVFITGASTLGAWQFDLHFDPLLLRIQSVTEGAFLSALGPTLFSPGVADDAAGTLTLVTNAFAGLPPEPSGAGVLANIEFIALGGGSSELALANVYLNFADTGFDVVAGQVTVIPEPASGPLALAALAASLLAGCRSRRPTGSAISS